MHQTEESPAVGGSIRSDEVGQGQQKDDISAVFQSLLNSPQRVLIISDDDEDEDEELEDEDLEDDEEDDYDNEDEFQLQHDDDID